jgi:hypothetical protein
LFVEDEMLEHARNLSVASQSRALGWEEFEGCLLSRRQWVAFV